MAEAAASDSTMPSKPRQPVAFKFPKLFFWTKQVSFQSFQPSWFGQWPFLHYDEAKDLVYFAILVFLALSIFLYIFVS